MRPGLCLLPGLIVALGACPGGETAVPVDAAVDRADSELTFADARVDARADAAAAVPVTHELTRTPQQIGDNNLLFDGEAFCVVWAQARFDATAFDLVFARWSPAGDVLRDTTLVVDDLPGPPSFLHLLPLGEGYVAWYRQGDLISPIWAVHLGRDGTVIAGPTEVATTKDYSGRRTMDVARTDDGFGLLFINRDLGVRFAVVSEALQVTGGPTTIASEGTRQGNVRLLWLAGAQRYLAIWSEVETLRRALLDAQGRIEGDVETVMEGEALQHVELVGGPDDAWMSGWGDNKQRHLLYRTGDGGGWGPTAALPANRRESPDTAILLLPSRALLAWESDATTSVRELRAGWIDLAVGPISLEEVAVPCSPTANCRIPRLALAPNRVGMLTSTLRSGSEHLQLTLIPLAP